ncbi:MAG: type 1 glutamine amidotransferase, partial [Thermoleophilaceae bacterium]
MRVLVVVHHRNAATGVFAEPALAAGDELVEWLPHEAAPPELDGFGAAMVFGGAMNVDEEEAHPWLRPEKRLLRELLERGTPLLGDC